MTKVLRDASCPVGKQCPQIKKAEGGYEIVGTNVPDPELPTHERRVLVPETMLPELGKLDIVDFEAWLDERRTAPGDMLRVQTRDAYAVPSDDADFAGYLHDAPAPTSEYREPFFQELRDEVAAGKMWRNLVVINGAPTDYQRYANEWVYTYASKAGQVIRILDLSEHPAAGVLLRTGDFWVIEHQHVALVRYDEDGQHRGEVAVEDTSATGYIAAAELAWQLGTPFMEWFAAYPQYHRRHLAA
ncbi:MAG: hypothetical protein JWO67_6312 [Streptosporangiaceae bacterium]|nr:hypothetical protein [Streptosporangiaceae bacterium]